ncbi:MAG: IS1 family transposase [Ardenticatenia bacterium]|nr:IS1 family transposase [Ardenticatenia bacterium]
MSMRGVERVFQVPRQRLAIWLQEEAETLPDLETTLAEPAEEDALELDELWSFVQKKDNKRWIWIALLRSTRQIVAYAIGDRSEASCRRLWERIPARYRRLQTFSDFWEAYQKVVPPEQHQAVGKETGQTAHVERWNNTLRQRVGRFVRTTLSFSKSETFHEIALKLFVFRYNRRRLALISQT